MSVAGLPGRSVMRGVTHGENPVETELEIPWRTPWLRVVIEGYRIRGHDGALARHRRWLPQTPPLWRSLGSSGRRQCKRSDTRRCVSISSSPESPIRNAESCAADHIWTQVV